MRRHILVDNLANAGLLGMTKPQKFVVGLLIGQITEDKDYLIHYIPTPNEEANEPTSVENNEDSSNIEKESRILTNFNEEWIVQHAKQVNRLLPGGIDVLGIFVIAPQPKFETNLRQTLFAIHKVLDRIEQSRGGYASTSRIAVEICSITKKVVCRSFNVSDHKSNAEPAEWKVITDRAQLNWIKLECQLCVDVKIPVSKAKSSLSFFKQIQHGLSGYLKSINNSEILIDDKFRDDSEMLIHSEKKKGKKDSEAIPDKFIVDILLETDPIDECTSIDTEAVIHLKGTIQVRAFVNPKVTVKFAKLAVRKDVIRSLISRCEIHCEDCLITDEEQSDLQGLHELPRRLFAPLNGIGVTLSDYVLMGEKPIDSMEVFNDILGMTPLEEEIEDHCEITPESCDQSLSGCSSEEDLRNEEVMNEVKKNIFVPAATAFVAFVAVAISYFFLLE